MADNDTLLQATPEAPPAADPRDGLPRIAPTWARPGAKGDETDGADRVLLIGRAMCLLITLVLMVLLGRVLQLQTDPPTQIVDRLDSQKSSAVIASRRGTLLDRRGRMMAVTRVGSRLFVDPALIEDRNTFSERVGYKLNYDPAAVEREVSRRSRSRYVVLDQRLTDEKIDKLESTEKLPGLATESIVVRDYPFGTLAGQVIGFVGADSTGLEGLERMMNERLLAKAGSYRYLRDSQGRPLWVESASYKPNVDGQTIRLSLDMTIQSIVERHLAEAVSRYGAESGQMVVMDPYTGEIMAMANFPTFDPTSFSTADAALRRNRTVTDVFEPGSIFKPFIWAAATQMGAAKPSELIDCTTSGVWRSSQGRRLRDAHGQGVLTWDGVLIKSSNIGMAIVGERVGAKGLYGILKAFGFGSSTGSGLPGEIGGLVNPLDKWTHYSVTSIPMGQEIGVTGIQMVRAFSALANGGLLVTPTIEAVQVGRDAAPIQERVISEQIAWHTRQVLQRVILEGTGRKANSKLYALFGKTGTAQLPDFENGGYFQDQYVSSFVAGAPVNSPRLVIGCFIHKPDRSKGHYGGTVAAPAVMKVMEESLLYLGVPPQPAAIVASASDQGLND